jgi:copper chaperone CopZ
MVLETAGAVTMESTTPSRTGVAHEGPARVAYRQFAVTGLTCVGEAFGLERHLREHDGVLKATVSPVTESAYVTYDPVRVTPRALVAAINAAGYGTG